jgi:hypothetical protein
MSYKLFLDDYRVPTDCTGYMYKRIGADNLRYLDQDWVVCKNFLEFIWCITLKKLPEIISFDHDLADEHYREPEDFFTTEQIFERYEDSSIEKTGYHCAKWLVEYCQSNNLKFPTYFVHSMNSVGTENIISYIENYKKNEDMS